MNGTNCNFMKIMLRLLVLCFVVLFISCDEESCWVCGSSGKCYNCDGKGYIKLDANVCDVCKGNGICFNCQGTGKIKSGNIYNSSPQKQDRPRPPGRRALQGRHAIDSALYVA
jgi:hypothetical protein